MPRHEQVHGHAVKKQQYTNNCFGCGPANEAGLRLKFVLDKKSERFLCRFRLQRRFVGPPAHAHGGIIATILDEAMGKVNKLHNLIALTSQMEVTYLKPVPLNQPLRVESRELSVRGRRHVNVAEILNSRNEVLARGKALFIAIDPRKMFAKFVER